MPNTYKFSDDGGQDQFPEMSLEGLREKVSRKKKGSLWSKSSGGEVTAKVVNPLRQVSSGRVL